MALTQEDQKTASLGSRLEIGANEYWFDKLRPVLIDFNSKFHTDLELNRTIHETINHCDGMVAREKWSKVPDTYDSLLAVIRQPQYTISGPLRYGSDEEKKALTDIIDKFNNFSMILKYEPADKKPKKAENRERLNYKPPYGGQQGYNLDDTSNLGPRPPKADDRIPNPVIPEPKYNF